MVSDSFELLFVLVGEIVLHLLFAKGQLSSCCKGDSLDSEGTFDILMRVMKTTTPGSLPEKSTPIVHKHELNGIRPTNSPHTSIATLDPKSTPSGLQYCQSQSAQSELRHGAHDVPTNPPPPAANLRQVVHCGPVGAGHAVKAVNNALNAA